MKGYEEFGWSFTNSLNHKIAIWCGFIRLMVLATKPEIIAPCKFCIFHKIPNIPKHTLARKSIPLNPRPIWTFDMVSGLSSNLMIYQGCKQSSHLNTNTKAYIGLSFSFLSIVCFWCSMLKYFQPSCCR